MVGSMENNQYAVVIGQRGTCAVKVMEDEYH